MSDSDNKRYEQELKKRRQEAEAKLWEKEERQQAEQRARKEVRAAEKRRQEEELRRRAEEVERQMKAEEERRRQKEVDDAFRQKADRQVAVVQVWRKNWLNKMNPEPLASPPSEEEMNLIDLPPLTKRQRVRYLPKKTPEQRREREAMVKELRIEPMGGENPCERCANFGILCLPQDLL